MNLTAKQELAVQAYISGMSKSEAYRAAYNTENMSGSSVSRTAHDVFANPKVAARIAELAAQRQSTANYTVEKAMDEAAEAMKFAVECGNPGALVAAITLRAKISGLLIDKKEIKVGPLDKLSHDDLRALTAAFSTYDGNTGEPLALPTRGNDAGGDG